jgi:hypothetical protein
MPEFTTLEPWSELYDMDAPILSDREYDLWESIGVAIEWFLGTEVVH